MGHRVCPWWLGYLMLLRLRRRAQRAGLLQCIETRLATGPDLGIGDLAGRVEFVLAFAVVHERSAKATSRRCRPS